MTECVIVKELVFAMLYLGRLCTGLVARHGVTGIRVLQFVKIVHELVVVCGEVVLPELRQYGLQLATRVHATNVRELLELVNALDGDQRRAGQASAADQFGNETQIAAGDAAVMHLYGQDIGPGLEQCPVRCDVKGLRGPGFVAGLGSQIIRHLPCREILACHLHAVQRGLEAVVKVDAKKQLTDGLT